MRILLLRSTTTRMMMALAFGLATLLCCCRLGLMKPVGAQAMAANAAVRQCCAVKHEGEKKTPDGQRHCPMCDGVVGLVVKADTDKVAPPVLLPLDVVGDFVSTFAVSVELQRVAELGGFPPPRPTLVSLHTCLLC